MTVDEKWCGYCAHAAEHVNDPNSPCYSCDRHKSSFKPANVIENIENRLVARAEKAEAENKKLRNILESLLGACMYADMNGELAENIHGDILDQAREALK